jgi:hypothetical protein
MLTCSRRRTTEATGDTDQESDPHSASESADDEISGGPSCKSGSVKFGYGSGTADLYLHWITDPDPDPPFFFNGQDAKMSWAHM